MAKKNIVIIYPGPSYRVLERFQERAIELSRQYSGLIITAGDKPETFMVGDFELRRISRRGGIIVSLFRQIAAIIRWQKRSNRELVLVTSYDPLKSGLTGLAVRAAFGCRFLCEVNGDYENENNYLNVSSPLLRKLKMAFYKTVEVFVLNRADAIKTLYSGQLSWARIRSGAKRYRFFNRTEIERFKNVAEEPTILSVGFPWYVKGMDLTVLAFKRISAEFPDWRLRLVGHFPDADRLIAIVDNDPRIDIDRPVHRHEMPEIIGRCGILVQASRTESMGRVLVEAMAAAKPRIAADVGGIHTTIDHGIDGILIPSEDVDELAAALRKMLSDKSMRDRLGNAAAIRAKESFSKNEYYRQLLEMYSDIAR